MPRVNHCKTSVSSLVKNTDIPVKHSSRNFSIDIATVIDVVTSDLCRDRCRLQELYRNIPRCSCTAVVVTSVCVVISRQNTYV